jgi:preprotein translocase subunit YajC
VNGSSFDGLRLVAVDSTGIAGSGGGGQTFGVLTLGAPGVTSGGGNGGGGGGQNAAQSASNGGAEPGAIEGQDGGASDGLSNTRNSPQPQPGSGLFNLLLPVMLGLFLVMIVMQVFAGKKQKKEREAMLGAIKKQDEVQTSGGMIGTVVEVKDDEVVLKIDSESNTRARFAKSAVQRVVRSH